MEQIPSVAGSEYQDEGAAVDPLCLPHDPQRLKFQPRIKILCKFMVQNIRPYSIRPQP